MMYMPSLFGENLFDDWMGDFDHDFFGRKNPLYGKHSKDLMKTDIREKDDSYELDIDLPGFKKDEIQAELKEGYLTISAAKGLDKDEKGENGRLIRQERYSGSMARSFYVGKGVTQEDVKAKFEDGILKLTVPKKTEQQVPEKKYIAIEG
jgi:HSP20 family molecular chaperone IbpA